MRFRLKAFALHLLCSASALAIALGSLFVGWYHWPGWYLSDAATVLSIMVGVDVVIGPLLTLVVANPAKPRATLARDLSVIAAAQLIAFGYGSIQLWHGRPLFYAFSGNCLSLIQAYDIQKEGVEIARKQNPAFVPHWYSLPRWIWAPLPQDGNEASQPGFDVTVRPQYFKPWEQGSRALRAQLIKLDDNRFFLPKERTVLKQRMAAAGLAVEAADTIAFTGRARPLLAVFDPTTLELKALLKPK
jgi:hypothetical protein